MDEKTIPSNEQLVEDLTKEFTESLQCTNYTKDSDVNERSDSNFANHDNSKAVSNNNGIEICDNGLKTSNGCGVESGLSFEDNKVLDEEVLHVSESEEEIDEEDDEYLKEQEKNLSEEEKMIAREEVLKLKENGNLAFKSERYKEAVSEYIKALNICPLSFAKERSILYANRAACRSKLGNKEIAIVDCTKAIELNPNYLKAHLRRAQLYRDLDKLDEALNDYQKVLEMDPNVLEARQACMTLPEEIKERNEKLKTEMIGKLKDLGNLFLRPFGLSTDNFNLVQDPNTGGYSVNFKK